MRLWITRTSDLPIREQLVNQVVPGILSKDLPPGYKLPSVRAVARRHRIHSNTVSAAWHELHEKGWLELRRGSGLYVRAINPTGEAQGELDGLLAQLLQTARSLGHQPEEVLARLGHLVHPRKHERIAIAEPDPAMRTTENAPANTHRLKSVPPSRELAQMEVCATILPFQT